MNINIYIDIE